MKLLRVLNAISEAKKPALGGTFDNLDDWKDAVKNHYSDVASKLKFKSRVEDGKHLFFAEIPGEDRAYGVFDMDKEEGEVLGEGLYGGVYKLYRGQIVEGGVKDEMMDKIEAAEKYLDTPEEIADYLKNDPLFRGIARTELVNMIKGTLGQLDGMDDVDVGHGHKNS